MSHLVSKIISNLTSNFSPGFQKMLSNSSPELKIEVAYKNGICIWEFLREICPSFTSMNCDTQFSDIFTRKVFGYFNTAQKTDLVSKLILVFVINVCRTSPKKQSSLCSIWVEPFCMKLMCSLH